MIWGGDPDDYGDDDDDYRAPQFGTCKHCKARIEWYDTGIRWMPMEPGTNKRHECKINHVDAFDSLD